MIGGDDMEYLFVLGMQCYSSLLTLPQLSTYYFQFCQVLEATYNYMPVN